MELKQFSETAALKELFIGRAEGYRRNEAYVEIVNEDQKQGLPKEEKLIVEFEAFAQCLAQRGIKVHIPERVGKFVYDQLTPRDIAVTIGRKILICNMVKSSRRYEVNGIFPLLRRLAENERDVIIPPSPEMMMEGGDIMVDKGRLLVGISQRTNEAGLDFLRREFGGDFELVPLHCRSLAEGENVLHLDCTFNPIGADMALIYPEGFAAIPDFLRRDYRWIEVNAEEQAALATNVLSLDEHTVISRNHPLCQRVNMEMRKAGLEVIELPFDGAPATGGSFRCCSLPLMRG